MTKVLLTGASGFVGSNVLEYLLAKTDWNFTCLCSWRDKGNPLNLQEVSDDERVKIISHDLRHPIPEIGHFEYIINLASESHVDRAIANPASFIENNVQMELQVLEYARQHKNLLEAFIQFSTDEVYGANAHGNEDVLLPANPYSASKAAQEMICLAYWRTYNLPIIITRSNNIVGKNQDIEKFVPKIADLIKNGKEVQIHTVNGKPGLRYYNPVQNVADALLYILVNVFPQHYTKEADSRKQVVKPFYFNLGGGIKLDNLEMARLVAKVMDKEFNYKLINAEDVRPGYDEFYPQTDDIIQGYRTVVDRWKAPYSLEQGLEFLKNA